MKIIILSLFVTLFFVNVYAQTDIIANSPDGKVKLMVGVAEGIPYYNISYAGNEFLDKSPLGLVSSVGDFSTGLKLVNHTIRLIKESYTLNRSKTSQVNYQATELKCGFVNAAHDTIFVIFRLTNNDAAFTYLIPQNGKGKVSCTIEKETTGFNLPTGTTTFITPQATAGLGYKNSKPSYEEEYTHEEPIDSKSTYGLGYTFPALFHLNKGWLLISETGVDSNYVGTRLSDGNKGLYTVAFPQPGENNNIGPATATATLPMQTSWKTIALGNTLKPIVESTAATDVVKPIVTSSKTFPTGRATWSWIIWQDASCNYDDQITYIDLAATLKCEFVLIDAFWDAKIGREKMVDLVNYAKSKNVGILLWYNSNGNWNGTQQTPKDKMDTHEARIKEMRWLQQIGVKGLKIDFFGGDKQTTMKLYQGILTDAATYGLTVNFHGTTLPRGWDRMYPNYVSSEAVLASENLYFQQAFMDHYPVTATIYPFTRNAVASMDFGPVFLNSRLSRTQTKGTIRKTTDAFEMATAVVFFSAVQHWGLTPDNLKDKPAFLFDYIRGIPTTWDETRFIDGYPGKYCVIARRKGTQWYVGAINGANNNRVIEVSLPMLAGKTVNIIQDGKGADAAFNTKKISQNAKYTLNLSANGGTVIYTR